MNEHQCFQSFQVWFQHQCRFFFPAPTRNQLQMAPRQKTASRLSLSEWLITESSVCSIYFRANEESQANLEALKWGAETQVVGFHTQLADLSTLSASIGPTLLPHSCSQRATAESTRTCWRIGNGDKRWRGDAVRTEELVALLTFCMTDWSKGRGRLDWHCVTPGRRYAYETRSSTQGGENPGLFFLPLSPCNLAPASPKIPLFSVLYLSHHRTNILPWWPWEL